MTDADRIQMGQHASIVLDNPAFQQALQQLQQLSLDAFKKTDIRDAEGLKLARQFAAVTDDFELILRRLVEGGRLAQLQLDRHRDEGRMQRALRKISG